MRELSHLEQLETRSDPSGRRELTTAYLGLVRSDLDPAVPEDTRWHPVDDLPHTAFDHGAIVLAGRERLRAKLSYTNIGFALAPETFTISELRDLYCGRARARGLRDEPPARAPAPRSCSGRPASSASPGRTGGRPAALFRFRASRRSRSPTSSRCCARRPRSNRIATT